MNCVAERIEVIERQPAVLRKTEMPTKTKAPDSPEISIITRVLILLKSVVLYGFGIYIAAAAGCLSGSWAGNTYFQYFQPVHTDDFSQLSNRKFLLYSFARYGMGIGMILGMTATSLIRKKLQKKGIISLWEEGIKEPTELAKYLFIGQRQVIRLTEELLKKGKIGQKEGAELKD
jgi:hypothetical protein